MKQDLVARVLCLLDGAVLNKRNGKSKQGVVTTLLCKLVGRMWNKYLLRMVGSKVMEQITTGFY